MKRYLGQKQRLEVVELIEWPPQSLDLKMIEQIWDYLDREKKTTEMWTVLQNAWKTFL